MVRNQENRRQEGEERAGGGCCNRVGSGRNKGETGNVPSRFSRGEYFSFFSSVTLVQSTM